MSVRESSQIIDDIFQAGHPVGLDGEGVNLGPKGQLTLVQVSLPYHKGPLELTLIRGGLLKPPL